MTRPSPGAGKPRLLIACHQIPFPRTRDGAVIIVHPLLEHLSRDYAIDLVCPSFQGGEQDRRAVDELRPYCDRIVAFRFSPSKLWRALIVAFDPRSLVYFLYPRRTIERRILDSLRDRIGQYDAVIIQDPHLAIFVHLFDPDHRATRVLIGPDYLTLNFERQAATPGMSLRRMYWWLTARRVARHEPRVYRMYDCVTYVSHSDKQALVARHPELASRISVVPIALDIASWRREPDAPTVEPETVLFTGNMNYGPNRRAVDWFFNHVWPSLREHRPSVRWLIVGYAAETCRSIAGPGVEIFDSVPEMAPFIHRAAVVVSPLQSGTGVKNKVIEAMAAGKCVVGTSLSFEGIDVTSGVEAIVVDDPLEMVKHLEAIFDKPSRRVEMEQRAAEFAFDRFEMANVMDRWRRLLHRSSPQT